MRIAVVGLNSFHRCGASTFMVHLVHGSDWDLLLFNPSGEFLNKDIPLTDDKLGANLLPDSEIGVLNNYDVLFFAAPRWGGDYDFLKEIRVSRVGVFTHDVLDFPRMNFGSMMDAIGNPKVFFSGKWKPQLDAINIPAPFSREMFQVDEIERDTIFCPSRPEWTKNHVGIRQMLAEMNGTVSSMRVVFNDGSPMTYERMAEEYCRSLVMIDADMSLSDCGIGTYLGPFYTTMEAWHFGAVPVQSGNYDGEEMVPFISCVPLTKKFLGDVLADANLREFIVKNGREVLQKHDPERVRSAILKELS